MAQQIVKAIVKGRLFQSVETRNIFHYGHDGTNVPDSGDYGRIRQSLISAWTYILEYLGAYWSLYEIETQYWDGEEFQNGGAQSYNLTGLEIVGDITSFQTSVLITAKTMVKKAIGRKFIPGIDELWTDLGGVAVVALADFATFCTVMLSPIAATGGGLWYPGTHGTAALFAPFTSITVGTILSTMRRRKPGYGI